MSKERLCPALPPFYRRTETAQRLTEEEKGNGLKNKNPGQINKWACRHLPRCVLGH